jgi:hypothetical protein
MAPGPELYHEHEANRHAQDALEHSKLQGTPELEAHLRDSVKPQSSMYGDKLGKLYTVLSGHIDPRSNILTRQLNRAIGAIGANAVGDISNLGHEAFRSSKDILEAIKHAPSKLLERARSRKQLKSAADNYPALLASVEK